MKNKLNIKARMLSAAVVTAAFFVWAAACALITVIPDNELVNKVTATAIYINFFIISP